MMSGTKNGFLRMCRLCISQSDNVLNLYPLFPKHGFQTSPSSNNFVDIIERFTSIKITPTDDLPQQICYDCLKVLKSMLQFENKCKQIDVQLHKIKQNLDESDTQSEIKIEIVIDSDDNALDCKPEFKLDLNAENSFPFCDLKPPTNKFSRHTIQQAVEAIKATGGNSDDKIACHICGNLYDHFHLKYHLNTHNGLKPFKCDEAYCSLTFYAPSGLKNHKRRCHFNENDETLFCETCKKGFTSKLCLRNHKRRAHAEPKLPCMVCKKLFTHPHALRKHTLVHSQERKLPCRLCEKSFLDNYTLRIHQRVHTQEKPFSCDCGASFAYKCLLKTHLEKGCKV